MTATTPTTITGVSILSRQKKRGHDVFELVLSPQGIEVRRPQRPAQLMSWDRVSEWEIEERKDFVLLTLRGNGATTPLVVPGWTLDDLEILMREVTGGTSAPAPRVPADSTADATPTPTPMQTPTADAVATVAPAPTPTPAPSQAPAPSEPTPATRSERTRSAREARRRRSPWKAVVTVVLLAALATAVILVLLQSAGIIDWSFLGPVA